jgi:hypothetical protein
MNKSQEIQSIIAQRQPLAQKLGNIETRLSSLYGLIQSLAQERDRTGSQRRLIIRVDRVS